MSFQPEMFISVGALNCFFTLRESYLHTWNDGVRQYHEVRSHHHFNLSQNATEAVEKAKEYAARNGMIMRSTVESIQQELNEIKRATADQLAERQRVAEALAAQWAADRLRTEEQMSEVIEAGFFPFGRFAGEAFEKAEIGYVNWMMDKINDFETGTLLHQVADKLNRHYQFLRLPVATPGLEIGTVGKREVFNATVVRVFHFDGQWGRTYIVKMVADNGACIVSKGSFSADVGDKLKFKATVKAHDNYKGETQTVVNRVAIVD